MANGVSFFTWLSSSQNLMSPDLVHKLAQTSSTQTFNSKGLILFGFGVQNNSLPKGTSDFGSKQNHFKPFENKWTRFSPLTTGSSSSSSRQFDNQVQPANHKCTDPESCKRQIVEDFEHERPIWKLTCYGHCKSAPCDIVGDISYEELRLAAYDDAGRGLSLQSIEHRNFLRRILGTKVSETAKKKSLCIVAHGRDDTKNATQEEWHMWTATEEWSTYTTVMLQGLHDCLKGIDTWRGMWATLGRQHAAWWYGSGAARGLH